MPPRRSFRPLHLLSVLVLGATAASCGTARGATSSATPPVAATAVAPAGAPPDVAVAVPSTSPPTGTNGATSPVSPGSPASPVSAAPTTTRATIGAAPANSVLTTDVEDHSMTLTIAYGTEPSQFGELSLPDTAASSPGAKLPIVVLIHGGFWRSAYGLDLQYPMAADLVKRGYAVWNIEYRRVGEDGGGYPGTLDDVGAAVDDLAGLAATYPLDLANVSIVGHSAGGHLAMWSASRKTLPAGAPGAEPVVVPRLVIGQGPVVDLVAGDRDGLGAGAVTDFIGGSAKQYPDRYAIASPVNDTTARLVVVQGGNDDIVPEQYTLPANHKGIKVIQVPDEDHFDLIDPNSAAWAAVVAELSAAH